MRRREAGGFVCDENFSSVVEPSVLIREAGDSLRDFLCLKSKAKVVALIPNGIQQPDSRLPLTTSGRDIPIYPSW